MSFLSAGAVFSPTTVAEGIVIEERAQPAGMCQQSNSPAHVFVMQSSPVKRALQAWEGKRRLGRMAPGNLSVLPAGLPMSWQWDGPVQSLHVSVLADVADALANEERPLELPAPFLFEDALVQHLLESLRMQAVAGAEMLRCEHLVQQLLGRVAVRRKRTRCRRVNRLPRIDRTTSPIGWKPTSHVKSRSATWRQSPASKHRGSPVCSPRRSAARRISTCSTAAYCGPSMRYEQACRRLRQPRRLALSIRRI